MQDRNDAIRWFVAKTNPRCEERAYRGLVEKGFHVHLPRGVKLVRRRHARQGVATSFPLLTGYMFVGLSDQTPGFYHLRLTDGVHSVLGRQQVEIGQEAKTRYVAVPARIVQAFREAEARGKFDQTHVAGPAPRVLTAGDAVVMEEGPLKGVALVFDDYFGRNSARVMADLFGTLRPIVIEDVDGLRKAA